MRHGASIGITLLFGSLFLACQSGENGGTGGTSSSTSGGGGGMGTTSSSSSSASSSGSGGAGGTGGASSSSSSSSSSASSSSGTGGSAPAADHLLISEVCVQPTPNEFVEIYNPTAAAVDLTDYYLSDNATYYGIAAGMPFNPPLATPGTDFLVQFPAGTSLAPGAALVIATNSGFEAAFSKCPDFILAATPLTCANGTAKAMVVPTNGDIGAMAGLSNAREMVVLFRWTAGSAKVQDVDYVTWGTAFDAETRADKSAVSGYAADTPAANQKAAVAPGNAQSIERCAPAAEAGEKTTGGNGINGHDETSESLDTTFTIQATPTPGVKNACL